MFWTNEKRRAVYVASNAELKNEHYYRRLWMAVRSEDLFRRQWLDVLADTFRDADVDIFYLSGEPYELPELDEVFDDHDMRWLSGFLMCSKDGMHPKRHCRSLEKLRLLDLYFRIERPRVAAHFSR